MRNKATWVINLLLPSIFVSYSASAISYCPKLNPTGAGSTLVDEQMEDWNLKMVVNGELISCKLGNIPYLIPESTWNGDEQYMAKCGSNFYILYALRKTKRNGEYYKSYLLDGRTDIYSLKSKVWVPVFMTTEKRIVNCKTIGETQSSFLCTSIFEGVAITDDAWRQKFPRTVTIKSRCNYPDNSNFE